MTHGLCGIDWKKCDGLVPAIVQDADTGTVLMMGYMDNTALALTRETGQVTFYSRSRQQLWTKGETSGNFLECADVAADCDGDTLLVTARPRGPTCHTGTTSCFGDEAVSATAQFGELDRTVARRLADRPDNSYTARLAEEGIRRVAQKVGEEGVELALAGAAGSQQETISEAADLIYHLVVLLQQRGLGLSDVGRELAARRSGSASPAGTGEHSDRSGTAPKIALPA